jgi:competence ComEA-like helix-hairpin-helix protein
MCGLFYFYFMWKYIEQYFTFSRKEKRAVIALCALILIVFIVPKVFLYIDALNEDKAVVKDPQVLAFIKDYNTQLALQKQQELDTGRTDYNPHSFSENEKPKYSTAKRTIEYFEFDPNLIGEDDWIKLGFSGKQAAIIQKYKNSGGKFYKPEDVKRVFVIGEEGYERLKPYIKITPRAREASNYTAYTKPATPTIRTFDINEADSAMFEMQKGIGPSTARRIVNYRNRLGGFVSVEQIKEVWGMPDSVYTRLKDKMEVNNPSVSKININTDAYEKMGKHPYINYALAKVIVAYREQHGTYKSVDELKNVSLITDSIFMKLKPYVTP